MSKESEIISELNKFIAGADSWSSQATMFVSMVIVVIVVFINVWLLIRSIGKNQDKLADVVDKNAESNAKLSHSIDLQNKINIETLNKLDKGINESLKMHEITHNDLSDLKKIVLSKRFNEE